MLIDDQVVILYRRQHLVPGWIEKRFQPGAVRRYQRQQHPAPQSGFGDELDVFDGFVQVVRQDEPDACTTVRVFGAEILQPAIVRADPGERDSK